MSLQQTKSLCHFYKSTSGLALGGGCTKAFLDSVHGDVSRVCRADGAALYAGTVALRNGGSGMVYTCTLEAAGIDMGISAGVVGLVGSQQSEILGVDAGQLRLDFSSWYQEELPSQVTTNGTHSMVQTYYSTPYHSVGSNMLVRTDSGVLGSYTIIADDGNGMFTISDDNEVYNLSATKYVAPELVDVSVVVGGAYNNFQTALDNIDAFYRDQWLFFNEDIAPAIRFNINDGHDGENNNNTRLCVVGYHTCAYDCLPHDPSCMPISTQNVGTHYKTALQRAKEMSDSSIAADLPVASTVNLAEWQSVFSVNANAENVVFMGIFFQVDANKKGVSINNDTSGTVYLRHCTVGVMGYDTDPKRSPYAAAMAGLGGIGTGGAVYDCFAKGVGLLYVSSSTTNAGGAGAWEMSYCIMVHGNSVTARNFGLTAHHNILMYSPWGMAVSTRGSIVAFSNIVYRPSTGGIVFDGAEGRLSAYNNVFIIDEEVSVYGLIGVLNGSAAYWDHNCYCNPDGSPVDVFTSGPGGSADNVNYNYGALQKGIHDVEASPQFKDPDNFDFNLKSTSPCIGAGRPDILNNPTSIGLSAVPAQVPVGIFGKKKSFYGA